VFHNRFQGSLVSDAKAGQYAFYRYHVPDPVYFHRDIRVTIQTIGGDDKAKITAAMKKGVPLRPVSVESAGRFSKLLDPTPAVRLEDAPASGWTNVYRRDDWSAVALFYLDSATDGLPPLPPVEERTAGMSGPAPEK
jgi:hypothetical protein